jgi:hypothetical protein
MREYRNQATPSVTKHDKEWQHVTNDYQVSQSVIKHNQSCTLRKNLDQAWPSLTTRNHAQLGVTLHIKENWEFGVLFQFQEQIFSKSMFTKFQVTKSFFVAMGCAYVWYNWDFCISWVNSQYEVIDLLQYQKLVDCQSEWKYTFIRRNTCFDLIFLLQRFIHFACLSLFC